MESRAHPFGLWRSNSALLESPLGCQVVGSSQSGDGCNPLRRLSFCAFWPPGRSGLQSPCTVNPCPSATSRPGSRSRCLGTPSPRSFTAAPGPVAAGSAASGQVVAWRTRLSAAGPVKPNRGTPASILAKLNGGERPAPYAGAGACCMEFGSGHVGRVDVDFLTGPKPTGSHTEASVELVREKQHFGSSRRARWLGL
jgi:hypothetical protein